MKTFLANAFAVGRLATVQEFHLSRSDTNAPADFYELQRRSIEEYEFSYSITGTACTSRHPQVRPC
uniref:Transposase n=1 Tax=Ascaris lumbricoides TaxID=6252 RepID=A0A0M3I5V9_ASCLU